MDDDRRDRQRTQIQRNAKIMVPHRSPTLHCTRAEHHRRRRLLKLANTASVPEYFELTFEIGRTRRACRVVWRTADMLGVTFEQDGAA